MPMINNDERLKLREEAKDFLIKAGSPVTAGQISNAINTNNHMVNRIMEEFHEEELVKPFILGEGIEKPITAWESTSKLKKINNKELSRIIQIEKPREE